MDNLEDTERRDYLDKYGTALEKDKDAAIEWRTTYEQRWLEAERQLRDGTTRLSGTKDAGGYMSTPTDKPEHQRATDNITKPIARKIIARIVNMLFGTDEQQADIVPSPVTKPTPTMLEGIDPNDPELKLKLSQKADRAAAAMEKQIKDYLAEADYSTQGRLCIKDACEVGTGVLHGPFPKVVNKKVSTTTQDEAGNPVTTFIMEASIVPSVIRLDYRRFYPKPCRKMSECEGVFLLDLMTPKQVKKLAESPGFDAEQIARLLELPPNPGILNDKANVSESGDTKAVLKGKYPIWKFTGSIDTKCLNYLDSSQKAEQDTVDGEVWFCQGITLKAVPSDDDAVQFHVFNYSVDPDSVFGWGVPHDIANDQYDRNLAWSAVKLNSMAAAYPIVGVVKGAFDTENGVLSYPFRKPILLRSGTDDINKVLQITTVPNTSESAMLVYTQSGQNAENHAMVQPMEQSPNADVKMGAAMFAMMRIEDNIIQSDAAKNWDDSITKPLFRSFIDFELAYGTNKEAKWAFDVVPKASSHLLTKDINAQQGMQVIQMAQNPAIAPFFRMYELTKMVIDQTNLDADIVMVTKEEAQAIQEQQAQQPNPEMMKIEAQKAVEQMKIDGEMQVAQLKMQNDQLVARMNLEAASIKAASDQFNTQAEAQVRQNIAALDAESKALVEGAKDSRERDKTAAELQLKADTLNQERAKTLLEIAAEGTGGNDVNLA